MTDIRIVRHARTGRLGVGVLSLVVVAGTACLSGEYTTSRDKTAKGAGIGAAAGAVVGAVVGEGHADKILIGAAIGAGLGAGIGSYMDAQEEKLARIPGTTVERVGSDKLLVRFSSDVLFDTDSAMLVGDAPATLDKVAVVLKDFPKTAIVVEGFTDSTGSNEHNQELSQRRATAVSGYFVDSGVPAARLTALGYGEAHPVADNDTVEGRQQNRRVAVLIKGKAK